MSKPENLPFGKKIIYSLGQLGWALGSFGVMNLLYYFYDSNPGADGGRMFPKFITIAAVLGIIAAVSRLFDAVTDPLIAGMSDRSNSKLGRRTKYMAIGGLPFALLSFLVFFPPVMGESVLNTLWLAATTIAFYFFMTMYVTPFFALMSELGHTPKERLQLSTMISITWALGFMIGNTVYVFQGIFEKMGYSPVTSFRIVVGIYAIVALILMYLPVFFIDENRYCEHHVSSEGSFEALVSAFKNKNFRIFTFSDLTYFLAMTFIQTGISYYVLQLLHLPKEMATTFMLVMFLFSFIFYVPVSIVAGKIGKKRLLIFAFIMFIISSGLLFFWGLMPFSPIVQGFLAMIISSIPMAIFGILPNAIVADIAEADGIENGNFKAGIFFGARTFMSKVGASITLLIFPLVIRLGSTNGESTVIGIRFTAVVTMAFLILGLLLFLRYNEKHVLHVLSTKEKIKDPEA